MIQVAVEIDFGVVVRIAENPVPVKQLLSDSVNVNVTLR